MKLKSTDLKFDMVENRKEYALCLFLGEEGTEITPDYTKSILEKYHEHITCIFFCGDLWNEKDLLENLQVCKLFFKTTGLKTQNPISKTIQDSINYLHIDKTEILPAEIKHVSITNVIVKPQLTDELLTKLYVEDKMSVKDISREYERDLSTIYRRLKKLEI